MLTIAQLKSQFPRPGRVELITIRPKRRELPVVHFEIEAISQIGLMGDHYASNGGKRQVTLIMQEHLRVVESVLGIKEIDPLLTRRNIITSGINLIALKGLQFQMGEALFECTGECHPCSRMEEHFGKGGYNAMRGHGGITARIIRGGLIKEYDQIIPIVDHSEE